MLMVLQLFFSEKMGGMCTSLKYMCLETVRAAHHYLCVQRNSALDDVWKANRKWACITAWKSVLYPMMEITKWPGHESKSGHYHIKPNTELTWIKCPRREKEICSDRFGTIVNECINRLSFETVFFGSKTTKSYKLFQSVCLSIWQIFILDMVPMLLFTLYCFYHLGWHSFLRLIRSAITLKCMSYLCDIAWRQTSPCDKTTYVVGWFPSYAHIMFMKNCSHFLLNNLNVKDSSQCIVCVHACMRACSILRKM